jgi:methylmalonyl-CoA/ethylmalonyl-CoA epimerase
MAPADPNARIRDAVLDHIAFGLARLEDAPATLVGVLGGTPHEGGPNLEFTGGQWQFERGARIEVIVPNDAPNGFMKRFIDTRGPGIHHVTFKVPDIYAAREHAEAVGYAVTGFNDAYEAWKELFLHPKSAHGIVVQLAQSHPDIPDEGWTSDFPFPLHDGAVPPRADVLGLRMSIRDERDGERLWSGLLGGRRERVAGDWVYRWPGSPLRIRVRADADAAEGPKAIEVAAARAGALTERGIEAMGSRFERVAD